MKNNHRSSGGESLPGRYSHLRPPWFFLSALFKHFECDSIINHSNCVHQPVCWVAYTVYLLYPLLVQWSCCALPAAPSSASAWHCFSSFPHGDPMVADTADSMASDMWFIPLRCISCMHGWRRSVIGWYCDCILLLSAPPCRSGIQPVFARTTSQNSTLETPYLAWFKR